MNDEMESKKGIIDNPSADQVESGLEVAMRLVNDFDGKKGSCVAVTVQNEGEKRQSIAIGLPSSTMSNLTNFICQLCSEYEIDRDLFFKILEECIDYHDKKRID